MPGQLLLPGFDAAPELNGDKTGEQKGEQKSHSAPRLTDGLFFGIFPDADIATRIRQFAVDLRDRHGLKGEPLRTDRIHCTLFPIGSFFGGLPPQIVEPALRAAAAVTMPRFDVTFDYVQKFGRSAKGGPFVLRGGADLAGLEALRHALAQALHHEGFDGAVMSRFTPHVTLLYDRKREAAWDIEMPTESLEHIEPVESLEPVRWTVREFVLIHSLLGRTRHIPLGRWPLLADQEGRA
jgi:RNA 2',3'-cyclic 3'-phosphodiesterase